MRLRGGGRRHRPRGAARAARPARRAARPRRGYFTRTFCEQSRYFHPDNGMRIDAIRDGDRPSSTSTGRSAAPADQPDRGRRPGRLDGRRADGVPQAVGAAGAAAARAARAGAGAGPGGHGGPRRDANELAARARRCRRRVPRPALQPALLLRQLPRLGDAPPGRRSRSTTASPASASTAGRPSRAYNSRRAARRCARGPGRRGRTLAWILLSFSDESFHDLDERRRPAGRARAGRRASRSARAATSAPRIGIHNPQGERVGTVSHLRNTEVLFVCGPTQQRRRRGHRVRSTARRASASYRFRA